MMAKINLKFPSGPMVTQNLPILPPQHCISILIARSNQQTELETKKKKKKKKAKKQKKKKKKKRQKNKKKQKKTPSWQRPRLQENVFQVQVMQEMTSEVKERFQSLKDSHQYWQITVILAASMIDLDSIWQSILSSFSEQH